MQGLNDIHLTLDTYIKNDTWIDNFETYSFNNIDKMKITPQFYYDAFISSHLLKVAYNNESMTNENNPFNGINKLNNLSFIKESNLLLGIQISFTQYEPNSDEIPIFTFVEEKIFDSKEAILNTYTNKSDFTPNSSGIQKKWQDFIVQNSKLFNNITFQ